ncbi:zinc-finger of transposase IS204/IS1001/IS1096/IS1165 [Halomonas daqiaonensis]|uniref:Zinc-finger of transposase IS204/IS1001/IS1096/IS1165 n=1 Tax=Halomonas daqiaonensis TaxID=650850 RepID=A0A1H7HLQ2_9GAMM|nr:zinc-finger of transposase IS204/IS1001/IS1096/IS1165 [Halomonas daqiaonensis]
MSVVTDTRPLQRHPAHDFAEKTWRHLNFFQHHCYLHARVSRTKCPEHGVRRIKVPWARPGSDLTLLFEQSAMSLVKEMPVLASPPPGAKAKGGVCRKNPNNSMELSEIPAS